MFSFAFEAIYSFLLSMIRCGYRRKWFKIIRRMKVTYSTVREKGGFVQRYNPAVVWSRKRIGKPAIERKYVET